jgi:hypothetical protein
MKTEFLKAHLRTVFIWLRNTALEQGQFFLIVALKMPFSLLRNSKRTVIKSTITA